MADDYGPVQSGQVSPFLKNRRTINATLEATRSFQRTRRPGGQFPFENPPGSLFVANLTEATGAASWQARTLVSGAWADDDPTGTNDAYPVQCGGSAFTPAATSTSIMWEEPAGSGTYAFLPIQYASATVPGFVSTAAQVFAGVKEFAARAQFDLGAELGAPGTSVGTDVNGYLTFVNSSAPASVLVGASLIPTTIWASLDTSATITVAAVQEIKEYGMIRGGTRYYGGDYSGDGLVFKGGLYISGAISFPPPPPPGVTSIGISSSGGTLTVTGSPVTGSGTINVETNGADGSNPDGDGFSDGLCTTVSTLGGVDTTWTVAVGDTVVISKGRIQSITPGS